ncbi:hypothetical protein ACFOYW_08580 [Gryllotalpicola reticulitermitis]|uniref:DUF1707 domain-containing protein n=1 Tax=Gryllotalpicola reticulitermitis TaxID=1184153 RepID=A0ABV8Q4U9_9MICO
MTDDVKYLKRLAYELRWRRIPEAEVEGALRTVATHATQKSQRAEQLFGPADRFAESFPRGRSLHRGYLLMTSAVLVAAAVVGAASLAELILNTDRFGLWSFIALVAGAVVWSLVAALIGSRLDRRLPAGWAAG